MICPICNEGKLHKRMDETFWCKKCHAILDKSELDALKEEQKD